MSPVVTNSEHSLIFGALDLIGRDHSEGWWFETAAEGADFGNPEPIVRMVASFLLDGGIETTESHGNREMTFRLCLKGEDSYALALGAAALDAEVGKRNQLTWIPPNIITGVGEPCMFQVVNSSKKFEFGDTNELFTKRIYVLTIRAIPWAFSLDTATASAEAPPATTPVNTLVDACSSTTGWAVSAPGSFSGGAISSSSGIVHATGGWPGNPALRTLQLTRTGLSATMTSTNIVRIKMTSHLSGGGDISTLVLVVTINGVAVTPLARDGDYYWYPCATSPLTTVVVQAKAKFPTSSGSIFLDIDEIYRTDTSSLSTLAGQRQQYMSLDVQGSARTQGSLYITGDSSNALGDVLVFTDSSNGNFQPNLRRFLTPGPTETTDTALVSGKSSLLSTPHYFPLPEIPTSGYVLYAKIKHASAGTYMLTWGADTVPVSSPSTVVAGTLGQSGTQPVTLLADTWTIVPIARMVLPPTPVMQEMQARVSLTTVSAVLIDEAWLLDADNGRLTLVECGSGTPADEGPFNRIDIVSATLTNPSPAVMMFGGSDDSGVGAGGAAESFGAHEFVPPLMNVFVVTTASIATAVSIEYRPAFHSHVVPVT